MTIFTITEDVTKNPLHHLDQYIQQGGTSLPSDVYQPRMGTPIQSGDTTFDITHKSVQLSEIEKIKIKIQELEKLVVELSLENRRLKNERA